MLLLIIFCLQSEDPPLQFESWSCHWSPALYEVEAEAIWAFPTLVNDSLTAASEISLIGRIAVVERGVIPLVFKARRVQVLALYSKLR